ncbi:hypothetical protein FSP39_004073 [Pinctada imbricata]|uniref:Uncharacterized protein n=1 Tax=Pinctada imbricata TaxID=66713 RepID=A0AA89C9P0_PINIB|nr:hypothetical protein FSP39_004073 [Pinctada imbricata]
MFISMLGEEFCERRMLKDFYDIIKGFVDDDIDGSTDKHPKLQQPITEKITNGIHGDRNHDNHAVKSQKGDQTTEGSTSITASGTEISAMTSATPVTSMSIVTPVSAPKAKSHSIPQKEISDSSESVVLPCKVPTCVSAGEEERIAEYLNRSDTAVIYPEPVSDREEAPEDREEDHDNDSSACPDDEDFILKCVYCDLTFLRASILQDHMKSSHPNDPIRYQCPKCEECFQMKTHLDKHIALHSPTSQSCKVCCKTFANVYRLQRHMISHNESTDLRKFKCTQCGKAFKFKHHLKEHIRIHSGEKPFECPNCHKRFSHSGSYSSHMTSKKCWIAGQQKGQGHGHNQSHNHSQPGSNTNSTEGGTNIPYSIPHPVSSAAINPSMNSIASSIPSTMPAFLPHLPFMHFNPAAVAGLQGMYTPAGPILPLAAYPMIRHNAAMKPVTSLPAPAKQFENPATSKPATTDSNPQISPDVNSNTQLVSIQKTEEKDGEKSDKEAVLSDGDKIVKEEKQEAEEEKNEQPKEVKKEIIDKEGATSCRHCGENFSSAVEQHQHERYLCKSNKDIVPRVTCSDSSRNSPCSTVSEGSQHGTPNGSLSAVETDGEEGEELYKEDSSADGKKFRMRSLINDEQLAVLKSYYQMNPRPRKYELIRIGNEIGFSKRVVQVWFQNMRARDRRQGKNVPYFPSMARFKRQDSPSSMWKDPKSTQGYIPVIPNPRVAHNSEGNGHVSTSKPKSEDQPLDLSVKPAKQPSPAHTTGQSPANGQPCTTVTPAADQSTSKALNLSTRSEGCKPPMPTTFQNSSIFKYMQQEGLFGRQYLGHSITTSVPNMMHPIFAAHLGHRTPHFMMNQVDHHAKTGLPIPNSDSQTVNKKEATNHGNGNHSNDDASRLDVAHDNLVIDESHDESSNLSSSDDSDSESHYAQMAHDAAALNLATLAEVSLSHRAAALLDSSMRSKRMRKKSWRQMEADEVQMDLDDSMLDEDHPLRKKRRSWKGHKVDADEGMYACDQCKKMFSKQSSLARHKYEHSGARPFTCEICSKAFKHKHHLTEHRRLHSGEKPFVCNKCGKRFSHSGSYSQHMNHRYKYCKPIRNDDGFSSM